MRLRSEDAFGKEDDFGKVGCDGCWMCQRLDNSEMTMGVMNFLVEALDILDMCHHSDESQILITTVLFIEAYCSS